MQFGSHRQGKASITGSTSATVTIWGADMKGRLHITKGMISVITPKAAAIVQIAETTGGGTSVATLFAISAATEGTAMFDFGDKGYYCSGLATTRLIVQVSGAEATVHAVFVGYSGLGS